MKNTGADFPLSEDISALNTAYDFHSRRAENRIVFQPMEGCDSEPCGSPGELTFRRYERYAKGGPGILWFEAVSISREARASRNQLYMNKENLDIFKRLIDQIKTTCIRQNGFEPIIIMQSTHSGRSSKPDGIPVPEGWNLSDDEIAAFPALFGESAGLAVKAGFDGMDIKACHRYLISELFSAYNRAGLYGGSFENRILLLMQAMDAAAAASPEGFILTTRLNVYDGFPYPDGFGVNKKSGSCPDLTEPLRLIGKLRDKYGISLINITAGSPAVNPHVSRPFDKGLYVPDEHPFEGVSRITGFADIVQKKFPDIAVVSSGLSYLREFSDRLAAGILKSGGASFTGFGRMTFAYPDFPRDIIAGKYLDTKKVCLTCGQCSRLLRAGRNTGCVVRDSDVYHPAGD
jgi:2,4-dienoyl-CoA reductase-like NADH-dependent reductase (Old Yellow Enzyme family)